jgi:hypothetical protein
MNAAQRFDGNNADAEIAYQMAFTISLTTNTTELPRSRLVKSLLDLMSYW